MLELDARNLTLTLHSLNSDVISDPTYSLCGRTRVSTGMLFQYSLEGSGFLELPHTVIEVPRHHGFLVTIPGPHRYYYESGSGAPWHILWVRFDGYAVQQAWAYIQQKLGPVARIDPSSLPIRKLRALHEQTKAGLSMDRFETSSWLFDWVMSWMKYILTDLEKESRWGHPIEAVKQYIQQELVRPLTLDELADYAGMSKPHFCAVFARMNGFPPIEYVNRMRIREAIRLLHQTDQHVQDIAGRIGFSSASYFIRVFRKQTGMTPVEYRARKYEADLGVYTT